MKMVSAAGRPHGYDANDVSLAEQIARIESRIRAQPTTASHRWALFQLLCVTGDWTRAVLQLQTWAKLEPRQTQTAQAFRDLIRAERWRQKVFAGHERPGFVAEPAVWVKEMIGALRLAADGQSGAADDARERALDTAPPISARTQQCIAGWIADSDTRLGPICEVITAGHYRWVPFTELAAWHISLPKHLIDLVWTPCVLTLTDGSDIRGFMPARYPGSEAATDTLRLGGETVWEESGRTAVIALGQKTWTTDQGDFGLFELASMEFGAYAKHDRSADGVTTGEQIDDRA
ncbi:ImpE/SciE family protein [Burkholderia ubonensis]|uniref:type VI secretion system accessory protein TagJ n=1 Tax=Burkholderia ubonensis TaxID=101571 RepID=UPI000755DFE5|nr:type VI secretion system accessory protein TagJ [Burkholderia ubonensis]KWA70832.1 ImpE/SciE family protein [Burkholderia ubonensis]KWB28533.1 ImpE/SciE family protein [Burkholderia ubonensis]